MHIEKRSTDLSEEDGKDGEHGNGWSPRVRSPYREGFEASGSERFERRSEEMNEGRGDDDS